MFTEKFLGERRTIREATLPSSQVLCHLRHLYIGVEFFNFIQDCILVIITKVVVGLLLAQESVNNDETVRDVRHALGFGAELTMARSCPSEM